MRYNTCFNEQKRKKKCYLFLRKPKELISSLGSTNKSCDLGQGAHMTQLSKNNYHLPQMHFKY